MSWKNLGDTKDLDDLESWSNGNGIKYSSAKHKVTHLQTNEKRLLYEQEDYQLRITGIKNITGLIQNRKNIGHYTMYL